MPSLASARATRTSATPIPQTIAPTLDGPFLGSVIAATRQSSGPNAKVFGARAADTSNSRSRHADTVRDDFRQDAQILEGAGSQVGVEELDTEFGLDRADQLDHGDRIEPEVVFERRVLVDLVGGRG